MFNWYNGLIWNCPSLDCGTNPCDYCKGMMEERDEELGIKEKRRKEYYPFLEPT